MSRHPPAGLPLHLLLPLLSSMVYVVGALWLKRAADLGADLWRTARVCNFTGALLFVPLALLGGIIPSWTLCWQPAVVALLFVAGQIFTLMALKVGDVSVATPVLGVKVLLVALLTTALLSERIGAALWTAALLTSTALLLLNFRGAQLCQRVGTTIVLAVIAAAANALFDVLVQKWSPAWGVGRFLPVMMVCVAVYSIAIRPWCGQRRAQDMPTATPAFGSVLGGAFCFALQSVMIVSSIAVFGQATVANVLYSSRGLWSVLAVWGIGHWFANRERHQGPRVLAWRFAGAVLLLVAILIVLTNRRHGTSATTLNPVRPPLSGGCLGQGLQFASQSSAPGR